MICLPWLLPSVPLEKRSLLPRKPGVYFACKGWRVLYIGRSTSLRDRWVGRNYGEHHHLAELEKVGRVRLHYKVLPKYRINHDEACAIALWKPLLRDSLLNGKREPIVLWVLAWDLLRLFGLGLLIGWMVRIFA